MKRKNNAFASPVNAPLTFQALQAADFPLKNRNKLTRSQSNNQDQQGPLTGTRLSGGGSGVQEVDAGSTSGEATTATGDAGHSRIFVNSSVPASLFTTNPTSTQLPEPDDPLRAGAHLNSALLPADMGMLRPTAAQRLPQNGLPSGTHIRRRPRSVARPGAGAHGGRHASATAAATSAAAAQGSATAGAGGGVNNASLAGSPQVTFASPQQIFIAPPSKGLYGSDAGGGGGGGGVDLLAQSYMSPELLSLSPAPIADDAAAGPSSTGAGKTAGRAGRDVKPLKYVRRAAPSPAPSRPVRANRRRQLPNTTTLNTSSNMATALNKSGSPTEHALNGDGWLDAEPLSRQPAPLARFTLPRQTSADADQVVLGNSARADDSRDSREHSLNVGVSVPFGREARPGSARRLAALTDAPTSAPSRTSDTLDFYLKLCAEVGEEPSTEWVRALEDAGKDGANAGSAQRKTRKEPQLAETKGSTAAAGAAAGPSRRAKSPGAGAGKPALKRSGSSGVGSRTATTAGGTSANVNAASSLAPGGGQRPPLTRKTAASAGAGGGSSIEDDVRLYCKTHLYPCLQKIATIEKYRKGLTEALEDFKSVCEEMPPTEAAAKALLSADMATALAAATTASNTSPAPMTSVGRPRSSRTNTATTGAARSGRSGGAGAGAGVSSGHRHGTQTGATSPVPESLSGTVNSEEPSSLNRLALRLSQNLAKLQDGATALLLTLAKYSKEARRPIGSVRADDDVARSTEFAPTDSLAAPQGFTKRLVKEESKTARLLESIRAEVESTLAATPCVHVEDPSLFQTPLFCSSGSAPTVGGHPRALGESGRALTLSHRSGTSTAANTNNNNTGVYTPRGGLSASAAPEISLGSPSPLGTRRHSAATSGRQRLARGSAVGLGGATVVAPARQTLAPLVKIVLPASSRRSSTHSEPGKSGAPHDSASSPERTPALGAGSGSSRTHHHNNNKTVLFVITSQTTPSSAAGQTFSRRGSFESMSSTASQTASPGHTGTHAANATTSTTTATTTATRVDRAAAAKTVGGASRSHSASAGAGKKPRATTAVRRSGSVKAGATRAATGGSGNPSTALVASNALPLRSSLRGSVEWSEGLVGDAGKARDATAEPSASASALVSARQSGPSREELEEARCVWEAMSSLARHTGRRSASKGGSSRATSEGRRKHSGASTTSSKTPTHGTATTATAAPTPETGLKLRPASADAFATALAAFDTAGRPDRASSESAPARAAMADLSAQSPEEQSAMSPLPAASSASATMVYESSTRPRPLVESRSSPNDGEDPLMGPLHPPLHGVDSNASNSLMSSPVAGLAALAMSTDDNESPNIASVSGTDDRSEAEAEAARATLSRTTNTNITAVVAISTGDSSSPPSSERLRRERHAAYQRRGRSQSILQVAPASEKDLVAVKLIMAYFRRFKARKQLAARLAQHRLDEEAQTLAQQRRVSEQRVAQFLWARVQRNRTRKAVAAAKRQTQLEAVAAAAAAASAQSAASNSAAAKVNAGTALTSRERLQLAKAQREAMRTDKDATASTARLATAPATSLVDDTPAVASIVDTVPDLPLAENGITTNTIANYNRDGDSFEVAVLHRLLLAPKALLYAVRTAIDAFPTRPPMGYAKATEDIRRSETSVSPERASQTPEREDSEGATWSAKRAGSGVFTASDPAQDAKDRREGVFRVPYTALRPYVLYLAELSAQRAVEASGVSDGATEAAAARAAAAAHKRSDAPLAFDPTMAATVHVPRSVRYESYVDVDELRHERPVVKPFPRPFETWGSAHNLVRRLFSAAAMYAWKLIFSHTPHDDYKQRQLRVREEQAARLDRVDQRNRMILACYAVHSEREWLREASKDLSFVGQIFNPKRSMDPNDPDLDRHCRETYEFVEDFLYQCFPTVSSLDEVPSFLVGAGLFFVLKEVFQWRADAPDSAAVLKQVPGWVVSADQLTAPRRGVESQRDQFLDEHPSVAMFHDSTRKCAQEWLIPNDTPTARRGGNADVAKFNAQPVDVYLTGFQHFEVLRYEQLSLLQRIARWIYEQRPTTEPKVSNVFSPLSPQQSMEVTTSLMHTTTTSGSTAAAQFLNRHAEESAFDALSDGDNVVSGMRRGSSLTSPSQAALKAGDVDGVRRRFSDTPAADELHLLHASVSGAALMHDRLAESTRAGADFVTSVLGGGTVRHQKQLTPAERRQDAEEAKKEQQVLPVKLVAIPTSALQAVKQAQGSRGTATSNSSTPSRGSAAGAASAPEQRKSACDYEHEQFIKQRQQKVGVVLSRFLENAGGGSVALSSKATRAEKIARRSTAMAATETEKTSLPGSEFMMVYPKNFLVDLSEKLTYELLGLRLHLGVCEELDAV